MYVSRKFGPNWKDANEYLGVNPKTILGNYHY